MSEKEDSFIRKLEAIARQKKKFGTGSPEKNYQNNGDFQVSNETPDKTDQNLEGITQSDPIALNSNAEGLKTFKQLRNVSGYIDKTDFILHFDQKYKEATCFLRPKRSGKSLTLKMLQEFYSLPKIDVNSYDPISRNHANINDTARATFEGTKIANPKVRKQILTKLKSTVNADTYLDDNMNKWPVIYVDLKEVTFTSLAPTEKEIYDRLLAIVIQPLFRQYDYVLFLILAKRACIAKYGEFSKENIERLHRDFRIKENALTRSKIKVLWRNFKKMMPLEIKRFYRLYFGEIESYDDILASLLTLTDVLHTFYEKEVIVLVDEHDAPAQHIYKKISFDDPDTNTKIKNSIATYSEIITDILRKVGKNCDFTKNFMMVGISNSIINAGNSGFNNVHICNVFNGDDASFFAMTHEEMEDIVDKLFKIKDEPKNKIKENIDFWFNGYYQENGLPLYSIFSSSLYISECYEKYTGRGITPDDTSEEWIPPPSNKWVQKSQIDIFSDYMNFGFEGKHNNFILDLCRDTPAYYPEKDSTLVPLFENPTDLDIRKQVIFHLLMYGGYLTQDSRRDKCYRIPNREIFSALVEQMNKYLRSLSFDRRCISELGSAMYARDVEKIGDETLKSLYNKFLSYKFDDIKQGNLVIKNHIHFLLWQVFEPLSKGSNFLVQLEFGSRNSKTKGLKPINGVNANNSSEPSDKDSSKSSEDGYRIDFSIVPSDGKNKAHFIFELNTPSLNETDMTYNALKGLRQIFAKDYLRHLRPSKDTKEIVSIGVATNTTHLSLALLEINVANGNYTGVKKIKLQDFWIVKDSQNGAAGDHSKAKEFKIDIFTNATLWNDTVDINEEMRKGIVKGVGNIMQEVRKSAK
jgi:hypothetical protein